MRVDVEQQHPQARAAPKDPRTEAAKQGERALAGRSRGQRHLRSIRTATPLSGRSDTIEFSAGAQQLLEQGQASTRRRVRPEMSSGPSRFCSRVRTTTKA